MQEQKAESLAVEGPIFSQAEADKVLDAMILDELQEDFLTWMTPELRQKLYTLKLDPAEKNFFEALRKEFGVDCEANLKQAQQLYDLAAKHGHIVGFAKAAVLKNAEASGPIDTDKQVFELLKCGFSKIQDVRASFWNYLASQDSSLIDMFKQIVEKYSQKGTSQYICLTNMLNMSNCDKPEDLLIFIQQIRKVTLKEHNASAAYLLLYFLETKNIKQLSEQEKYIDNYIQICQQKKFYAAFNTCAKYLMKFHREKEALAIAQEGYANGDLYCAYWLVAQKVRLYGSTNFQGLQEVLEIQIIISLTQHCNIYEFIFIHNLLKRKYKDYNPEKNDWIERQLKKVLDKYNSKADPWIKLPTDYMLMIYFDSEKYSLEQKDQIITEIVGRLSKKQSKRLVLYFLTKIRRRRYKQCLKEDPEQSQALKYHLKEVEDQFAAITLSTINDQEYPTNFFRLGKCYEKGYGVDINLKNAYLIYSKVLKQFERMVSDQDQVLHMSFVNFYSFEKTKKRLQVVSKSEEVQKFLKKIHDEHNQMNPCQICIEQHTDLLFYPCLHYFCQPCYETLKNYQQKCPKCRARILLSLPIKYLK